MTSNERIIFIFLTLLEGEEVNTIALSNKYAVNLRTIQRDISIIRTLSKDYGYQFVYHDLSKSYTIKNPNLLGFKESLALIKILLASRAFPSNEMENIIQHIVTLNTEHDANVIEKSIRNELTFYFDLKHQKELLSSIDAIFTYIRDKKVLNITYQKNDQTLTERIIMPISIFFSEYYFYVVCYELNRTRYINLRLDRFIDIQVTNKTFIVPYKDRFEDKELREKMLFMQYGKMTRFKFIFSGIVEAALDKFPNSSILETFDDGRVLIEASAYDQGIIMWMLSQGKKAKIISPPSLVKSIKKEIETMGDLYK